MPFHVGQRVVCIDDIWRNPYWFEMTKNKPKKGNIYTVSSVVDAPNGPAIRLFELSNPVVYWGKNGIKEPTFAARRFRPVTERGTDISVFEKMLASSEKKLEEVS